MFRILTVALMALSLPLAAGAELQPSSDSKLLVYGASGRIGSHIVNEALLRGYQVTGVSRDAARLASVADRIEVIEGDILNREQLSRLAAEHDAVIVSVGGAPRSQDPSLYIAALAAEQLIGALAELGDDGPRLLFVGNLFTLEYEDGKTLLELGRVPETHKNYAMFHGHQIALDLFRASQGVNWTVASPPNGLRLEGRTGKVRWGGDTLLRDADGTPSQISLKDYAFAILEELEQGRYQRQRFNVAR